jgi:diadenylate cyclase
MILLKLNLLTIIIELLLAIIDIFICTFIFYKFYQILAQTKAVQVIKGLAFFVILYIIAWIAKLEVFLWLLNQIGSVVVIAVIILFQPELRRVLTNIGEANIMTHIIDKDPKDLTSIINAVHNLQIMNIGALIVFERKVGLRNIIETGTILNSKISTPLLITIFQAKTPLHDGAVIIRHDTIVAAGCFLPLSETKHLDKNLGTRHRSALGIAEETDALVIIVSEETGKISLAYDSKIHQVYDIESLKKDLFNLLGYNNTMEKN